MPTPVLDVVGVGGDRAGQGLDLKGGHNAHCLTMSLSLLKYCEAFKVTVADVARDADLDPKWLYKVAKGERGFSPETAAAIETATKGVVTPSDLNKARMDWLAANPASARKKKPEVGKKAPKRPFVSAEPEGVT